MYHFNPPPPLRLSSEVTCVGVGGREGLPVLFHLAHTPVWPLMFLQCSLYVVATCSSCHSLNFTLRWLFRVATRFSSGMLVFLTPAFVLQLFSRRICLLTRLSHSWVVTNAMPPCSVTRYRRTCCEAITDATYNAHLAAAGGWLLTHHWVFNFFTAPST